MTSCRLEWGAAFLLIVACDDPAADVTDETGATGSTGAVEGDATGTDGDGGSEGMASEDGDESSVPPLPPPECDAPEVACGQECADLSSDVDNCGVCGVSCVVPNAAAVCEQGSCGLAVCEEGWANCDGTVTNGCEQVNMCQDGGACATECGTTGGQNCDDPCAPTCIVPAESCNFEDDDCDGECDEDAVEGCRVGVHLAYDPVWGQVLMTDANDALKYGVTIEQMNYFYLYVLPGAGSQPLQRCVNGGMLGYSEENGCGMFGGYESTLGFFGTEALCGAVPLTRMIFEANNATRMVMSQAEIDSLVAAGWVEDTAFGAYAWPNP
ncbi:MAG: hypothetical protein AAF721_03890 [Myxococcota bacterium]